MHTLPDSFTATSADPKAMASDVGVRAVSVYLLAYAYPPAYSTGQRLPLKLLQRYLITTWSPDTSEAGDVLARLIFSALEAPDLEVTLDPLTPADWLSFGVAPRPSFILSAPIELPRPIPETPLVRAPITLQAGTFVSLFGQVVGPAGTPIVGALIDYPALAVSTHTDRFGRFQFSAVPGEGVPKVLRVVAKGRAYQVTVTGMTSAAEPFVIRVEMPR